MNDVIRTENLSKSFRSTSALSEATLAVPEGAIYALVGANGAGKTALIKLLMNIFHPTSGWARVMGIECRLLAGKDFRRIGSITFQMSRAFFDQVRFTPVTLHFTMGLTRVQTGNVRSIPLPMQDLSVPDFGICSPQAGLFDSRLSGIACRFALHQPRLTFIRARWMDSPCSASQPGLDTGVPGDAWIGSLESSPADFAIAPVWSPQIALSNATKMEGNKPESRYLCPGTPVTFTRYNLAGRTQYDFTIPDFRFPSYEHTPGSFNGAMAFDVTAQ
jgi:energy-coupling factor transporter ATP-binding protein EcfA2